MFVGAGIGGAWTEEWERVAFFEGYGETDVDAEAIAYFRYQRFIEDVAEYAERLLTNRGGMPDRVVGLRKFMQAFEPGGVVDIAIRTDRQLLP